ncbi:hypothetical protein KY284_007856 [Solanum tuberosum]|nr:hypothetical protein KY284_007856 [Solanum tuberosum]
MTLFPCIVWFANIKDEASSCRHKYKSNVQGGLVQPSLEANNVVKLKGDGRAYLNKKTDGNQMAEVSTTKELTLTNLNAGKSVTSEKFDLAIAVELISVAGTFSMFKEASIADSRQKLTPTGDDEVSESSQLDPIIKQPLMLLNTTQHEVIDEVSSNSKTWAEQAEDEQYQNDDNERERLEKNSSPISGSDDFLEEDEEEEENILDICFDKVARDGDISQRQQRSGSKKLRAMDDKKHRKKRTS